MTLRHRVSRILSTLLLAGLCSAPLLRAQQTNPTTPSSPANPATAQQPPETTTQPAPTNTAQPATAPATAPAQNDQNVVPANQAPADQTQQQWPASPGTTVNPSQAPLAPVTTYPDASDQPQQQPSTNAAPAQTTTIPEGPKPKPQTEPVGAATAESVPTSGGAAAKPAGVAIAPAKQHQTRSLILKLGAVAAAGAALGTIFALSHGTSSTPPGTGIAGVTGR
jgi:hypothetical protein